MPGDKNKQSPSTTSVHRGQGKLVHNLNQYLENQDLPVRMEVGGVCRGLSVLRCKYVLEGREQEYLSMLDKISNLDSLNTGSATDLNHFIVEVIIAFAPALFDSKKGQSNALSNLAIGGKPLSSSLDFSMITSDENWISIFKAIDLQQGEAIALGSPNHAFSLSRLSDGIGYRLADPNDRNGFIDCPDEQSLITALHKIAKSTGFEGSLGLEVEVIRHPNSSSDRLPPLPSIDELYSNYMTPHAQFKKVSPGGREELWDQLNFACRRDNLEVVKHLVDKSQSVPKRNEIFKALILALSFNNSSTSEYFLDRCTLIDALDHAKMVLFDSVIGKGTLNSLELLLKHEKTQAFYLESVLTKENAQRIIHGAAKGGRSPEILRTIMSDLTTKANPALTNDELSQHILRKRDGNDAIEKAIGQRGYCGISNKEVVSQLLNITLNSSFPPSDENLLNYLLLGVKTNQPHLVKLLCETITRELPEKPRGALFKSVYISVDLAIHTDHSVLKELEKAGVNLSMGVHGVMEKKSGRSPGILTTIGIQLSKFSDWLSEITKENNVSYCKEKFKDERPNIKREEDTHSITVKI